VHACFRGQRCDGPPTPAGGRYRGPLRLVERDEPLARLLGFKLPEAEGIPMVGPLDTGGH
jgi:hypothetical protein